MRRAAIVTLLTLIGCASNEASVRVEQAPQAATADSAASDLVEVEADALPGYEVLERIDQLVGGTYGDVLIPTLPVTTAADTVEAIVRYIAEVEGLAAAGFYRTMDARRADFSASFAEQHPTALRDGLLGSLRDGRFRSNPHR